MPHRQAGRIYLVPDGSSFRIFDENMRGKTNHLNCASFPCFRSQVLLSSPVLHPLLLRPLATNPTMTPPRPLIPQKTNPPPPLPPTHHMNHPTRLTAANIPQPGRSRAPPYLLPSLSQNLSPRMLEKIFPLLPLPLAPLLLPDLPSCQKIRPLISVTGTLTR